MSASCSIFSLGYYLVASESVLHPPSYFPPTPPPTPTTKVPQRVNSSLFLCFTCLLAKCWYSVCFFSQKRNDQTMEDADDLSFEQILESLLKQRGSRDPRARRLASAVDALLEVVGGGAVRDDCSSYLPAQVYAQGMTALEGTLLRKAGDATEIHDSLGTQVALLELLSKTIGHVEPAQIIVATLAVPSRVFRGIVSFCQSVEATGIDTEDELGGVSAVLQSTARACGQIALKLHGTKPDIKLLQQFWKGTVLALIQDPRPKVRKCSFHAVIEVLAAAEECPPVIRNTTMAFLTSALRQTRKKVQNLETQDMASILPVTAFLERAVVHLNDEKILVDVMELLTALLQSETEAVTGANATTMTTDFVAIAKQKKRTDGGVPIRIINALLGIIRAAFEDSEDPAKLGAFASRVLASLLTAQPMWIFRPGMTDASIIRQGRTVWGQVLLSGSRRILHDDTQQDVAFKLLPLVVQMELLLAKPVDESDEEEASVAFQLFVEATQIFREYMPMIQRKGGTTAIRVITTSLEQVFQPIFRPTWAVSLKAFVVCLQYSDDASYASDKVEMLIKQRNESSSSQTARNSIEDALSTLVQSAGLEKVWSWMTWPDIGSTARDRGWVLGLLKSAGQLAQPVPLKLALFQDEVLSLARRFDRAVSTGSAKHKLENRLAVVDTWRLLPCFFQQFPPDVADRLPGLITTMVKAMEDSRYPELTPVICNSISLISKVGQENQEMCAEIFESAASTLLPVLFKMSMSLAEDGPSDISQMEVENDESGGGNAEKGQQQQVLGEAVCSLCSIANKSFLQGLYKKLMHRLLEEMQRDSPSDGKLCAYLSLTQSLVKSSALDENSIGFLFRALKPALRDGQHGPRSLKRAYKLLAEICERHSSFFSDPVRLDELSGLLKETAGSSQVAARYMRLRCMSRVVDGLESHSVAPAVLDKILAVTSEILVCLKDSNGKTRDAAYELLMAIAAKSDYDTMLRILTASLAAETAHIRSASVMALSRIVYDFAGEKEEMQKSLASLLGAILCLLVEDSREVIGSVVGFVRVCVSAIPTEQLQPLLPELVGSLLRYHKVKDRFRSKIKIILKKLVKRFGYDGLMPHVPKSESRLLTHMRKVDERLKRRKMVQPAADTATKAGFEEFLDSDEEDSDNGRTFVTTVAGDALTKASRKSKRSRANSTVTSSKNRTSAIQLPSESDGNILDMLGSNISKRVSFAEGIHGNGDDSSNEDVIEFNDDGMLVIREALEEKEEIVEGGAKKRRRLSKLESVKAGDSAAPGNKGSKRSNTLGHAYKSKRAGGDVRRKDQKYEPYAFVPLNAKAYSKKHRKNAVETMSSVVRTGKKHT